MRLQIHATIHTRKVEVKRERGRIEPNCKVHWKLGLATEIIPWDREEEEEKHQIRSTNTDHKQIHDRNNLPQQIHNFTAPLTMARSMEVETTVATGGKEWR